jgi:hypothetical protein
MEYEDRKYWFVCVPEPQEDDGLYIGPLLWTGQREKKASIDRWIAKSEITWEHFLTLGYTCRRLTVTLTPTK